jgi:hypothetical protein
LVQAARQWWKMYREGKAKWDYYPSKSDPCLFIKKAADGNPISFFVIYDHVIKEVISNLCKVFKVKTMGEMDKFKFCHIMDTIDKDGVWIH